MNHPYARVNQPYATLTHVSALCEIFGVQLYKNNARVLLSHILSVLKSDGCNMGIEYTKYMNTHYPL